MVLMGSCSRQRKSPIRDALCGLDNNQLGLTSKSGREYEGEYGTHLFKSFSPVFAVSGLHPVLLICPDVARYITS